MIGILITYLLGMASGSAATVILALLIDIASYRTKPVKKKGVLKL